MGNVTSISQDKVRDIFDFLQYIGGEGNVGKIGSKFEVKRPQLRQAGFILTPSGGGQFLVTAGPEMLKKYSGRGITWQKAWDTGKRKAKVEADASRKKTKVETAAAKKQAKWETDEVRQKEA